MANIPRFCMFLCKCITKNDHFAVLNLMAKSLYLQGVSAILLTEERKSA